MYIWHDCTTLRGQERLKEIAAKLASHNYAPLSVELMQWGAPRPTQDNIDIVAETYVRAADVLLVFGSFDHKSESLVRDLEAAGRYKTPVHFMRSALLEDFED